MSRLANTEEVISDVFVQDGEIRIVGGYQNYYVVLLFGSTVLCLVGVKVF